MVDEVDGISQWALAQGGAGSMHIDWLAKQHELHTSGRRKLKGDLWMSMAVDIPPRLVKVRRATTYMAFSCPKGSMEGNYCVRLSPTELQSMVKTDEFKAGSREVEAKLDVFLTALNTSPEYKNVPVDGVESIISEGDEVLSNAECPADDARSGLTKGCALTSDCSTGCVMVEPSSGVGVAAEAPCLDVIATTIARRSRCVRSLGVYWGFAEWVVWGILKQTRVLMLCADNIIDIAATFCGEEMRHRPV